jgi:hypothetical protein
MPFRKSRSVSAARRGDWCAFTALPCPSMHAGSKQSFPQCGSVLAEAELLSGEGIPAVWTVAPSHSRTQGVHARQRGLEA